MVKSETRRDPRLKSEMFKNSSVFFFCEPEIPRLWFVYKPRFRDSCTICRDPSFFKDYSTPKGVLRNAVFRMNLVNVTYSPTKNKKRLAYVSFRGMFMDVKHAFRSFVDVQFSWYKWDPT